MGRVTRYAIQNMVRNFALSCITLMVFVVMLVSVNTLLAVRSLTAATIAAVDAQVEVSVFFTPDAPQNRMQDLVQRVSLMPETAHADFISRDDALAQFKDRHSTNPELLRSLDIIDTNPLGAILVVRARAAQDYEKILAVVRDNAYADIIQDRSFEDRTHIVDRVTLFTTRAEQFSFWLAALFTAIALLIIFNTVRVAIYTQRDEIGIKKLVGATNGFIRAPFFIEGLLYAVCACAIAAGIVWAGAHTIDPLLGPLFTANGFSLRHTFFGHWYVFGFECVLTLVVVWGTIAIAMRRYLRT